MKKTLKIGLAWVVMSIAIVVQVVIDIAIFPIVVVGCLFYAKDYKENFVGILTSWVKSICDAVIEVKDMCNEI